MLNLLQTENLHGCEEICEIAEWLNLMEMLM